MTKILPEETHNPNRFLDNMLYRNPTLAIDTVERGVFGIFQKTIITIHKLIHQEVEREDLKAELALLREDLTKALDFTEKIPHIGMSTKDQENHTSILHLIDHLHRLIDCLDDSSVLEEASNHERIQEMGKDLQESLSLLITNMDEFEFEKMPVYILEEKSKRMATYRKNVRLEIFQLTAAGKIKAVPAMKEIDSVRWFDKIHYYLWRISFHFQKKI